MTFEDPSRRALLAGLSLRLTGAAALLVLAGDAFQIVYIGTRGLNPDDFTLDDVILFVAASVYLFALISSVIWFSAWELRIARNAKRFDASVRYSPGWAVGWWFVPLANLVLPNRVMSELWRASGRDGSTGPAYLGAWWGCWVGGILLGTLAGRVSGSATSAPVAQLADVIDLCSNALTVAGALLAMRLVADLTRRQLATADQRADTSSSSESANLGPGRLK